MEKNARYRYVDLDIMSRAVHYLFFTVFDKRTCMYPAVPEVKEQFHVTSYITRLSPVNSSKLKEFADNNFKCDKIAEKFFHPLSGDKILDWSKL